MNTVYTDTRESGRRNGGFQGRMQYSPIPGDDESSVTSQRFIPSYRLVVCLLCSYGAVCSMASQALVGASLLLMTRHDSDVTLTANRSTAVTSTTAGYSGGGDGVSNSTGNASTEYTEWQFAWSKSVQSRLLTSYFVGYYVMQLPSSWLMRQLGAHRLMTWTSSVTVLCQGLSIWIPRFGHWPFGALLFFSGMFNACSFLAFASLTGKWCFPKETSVWMSFVMSGLFLGNGIMFSVISVTSEIELIGGWPFSVLFVVVLWLIFHVLWRAFATESPEENKWLTARELACIRAALAVHEDRGFQQKKKISLRKVLTSPPVYAIAASLAGCDWILYLYITVFPPYLRDVCKMATAMVAILSGVPWFASPITSFIASRSIDLLREKGVCSTNVLRKIADVIGKPLAAALLLMSSFWAVDDIIASTIMYAGSITVFVAFMGSSWAANVPDLTADHGDVVMAIAQTFSMTGPFLAPLLFDAMTPNNTIAEWQWCFVLTLAVCVVTSLIYIVFGSSQVQNWDDTEEAD